jgi:8-oxo-dGTP pyrophosphatase MutT (NUDIX family)
MKNKEDDVKRGGYFRPQICRNCGINGHLYKDCLHPIMSFGIICYKIDNGEIKYIMIQRKDSLAFMEFVRGKYNQTDINYIKQLIDYMTENEKEMILENTFDSIWNYTWCQSSQNIFKHTKEYIESKTKFDYVINNSNFVNVIKSSKVKCNYLEQEWGFPKGRKKIRESDIDCAVREFCEETQLYNDDIQIVKEIYPFQEIFFGTNNILYKHVYYVAKIVREKSKIFLDNNCLEQVREVRDIKWLTYAEVLSHIKYHNIERIEIFKKAHNIINDSLLLNIKS